MKIIAEHLKYKFNFRYDDEIIKILELENGSYVVEEITGSGFRSFKPISEEDFKNLKEI